MARDRSDDDSSKGWNVVGDTLTAFLYWTADEADARGVGGKRKVQPAIKFE
jgi:hypothetical protein